MPNNLNFEAGGLLSQMEWVRMPDIIKRLRERGTCWEPKRLRGREGGRGRRRGEPRMSAARLLMREETFAGAPVSRPGAPLFIVRRAVPGGRRSGTGNEPDLETGAPHMQ